MANELIPIVGPISAAVIAGSITFIITVLSKEQKTSDFRQAWIDALRVDIADLIGFLGTTTSIVRTKIREEHTKQEMLQYLLGKEGDFVKIEILMNRIKLRINPEEHKNFVKALNDLADIAKDIEKIKDRSVSEKLTLTLLSESQRLLKKEWKRVKRGELIFVITKWASLAIFLAACIFGAIYLSGHIEIQYAP